jgi:hypothetical protein
MVATFQIPLDIPDVEILSTQVNPKGDLIIEIKSTLSSTRCRRCGKEITRFHGYDKAIRLGHFDSGTKGFYPDETKALSMSALLGRPNNKPFL